MAYRASVYRVMIASPSDVSAERRVAVDVIHEWNAIHSSDRHIVLIPVTWELHASPAMGDRPQSVINRQVLRDSDLLVAMFWTRLGTPTGVAASGTVEEIDEHLSAGKRAMIYFSSSPVRPDSVADDQYAALRQFKDECRKRGLIEEYDSVGEFREKFARQLTQTVIRDFAKDDESDVLVLGAALRTDLPALSEAARELLAEAAKDASDGAILCLGTIGGLLVQANGKSFTDPGSPRSEARWRGAVKELSDLGLVEDRGHKGEVFSVTDAGYRVADGLT
jgi:hypothetical protein